MRYKFAKFILDDEQVTLTEGGQPVSLNDEYLRVLILLVQRAAADETKDKTGAVVDKGSLLDFAWGESSFVEENNVDKAVAFLRSRVFGEDPRRPFCIKTITGKGYRFIHSLEVLNDVSDNSSVPILDKATPARQSDVIGSELYSCLRLLAKQNVVSMPLNPIEGARWVAAESDEWLAKAIIEAMREISVISYSFTHGFNKFDDQLAHFLARKNTSLQVLMLDPEGPGFALKTGMEAFKEPRVNNKQTWIKAVQATRRSHKADIESGIAFLENLKTKFGEKKVRYSLYKDTPNLKGVVIDGNVGALSSYFFNPINRGLRSPVLLIDNFDHNPHLQILRTIFLQWFEINLAIGRKSFD